MRSAAEYLMTHIENGKVAVVGKKIETPFIVIILENHVHKVKMLVS